MKSCIFILLVCLLSLRAQGQTLFYADYNEAKKIAQEEKRYIFIDFYTEWCGPCKRMTKEVFPEKRVGEYLNQHFISIKLNAEREGKELAEKFGVNAYPTFVIINTNEEIIFKLIGAMDADRFINSMRENMEHDLSPSRIKERYESGEREAKVVELYTTQLIKNNEYQKGREVIANFYNTLTREECLLAENIFIFLRYTLDWDSETAQFFIKEIENFDPTYKEETVNHYYFLWKSKARQYFKEVIIENIVFNNREELAFQKWQDGIKYIPIDDQQIYTSLISMFESKISSIGSEHLLTYIIEYENLDWYLKERLLNSIDSILNPYTDKELKKVYKEIKKRMSSYSDSQQLFAEELLNKIDK